MKITKMIRTLVAFSAVVAVSSVLVSPAFAQDDKMAGSKMSGSKMSSTKTTKKVTAAKEYVCKHCKMTYTAAEAKKKNMKCCNLPLAKIKSAKKADPAKKS